MSLFFHLKYLEEELKLLEHTEYRDKLSVYGWFITSSTIWPHTIRDECCHNINKNNKFGTLALKNRVKHVREEVKKNKQYKACDQNKFTSPLKKLRHHFTKVSIC